MATNIYEIHGFKVEASDDDYSAVTYLRDCLDYNEAIVFFDYAKLKGKADFENRDGYDFSLLYDSSSEKKFKLVRRG